MTDPGNNPTPPSNRIEVDLALLGDRNLQLLSTFNKEFKESVEKLETMMGSFAKQLDNAANAVAAGGGEGGFGRTRASAYASIATNQPKTQISQQPGSTADQIVGQRDFRRYAATRRTLTIAEEEAFQNPVRFGGSLSAQDLLLGLSRLVGTRGIRTDEDDVTGKKTDVITNERMANLSAYLGYGARVVMPTFRGASQAIQRFRTATQNPTMLGAQLGYSTNGIGPLPIFSPAFNAGMGRRWDIMRNTDFGLNPMWSGQQAAAAWDSVAAAGFRGDTADTMQRGLKTLGQHLGLDPTGIGHMGGMMDRATRFGNQSVQDFTQSMLGLSQVAANANMTTDQLAASLDSLSQQMGGMMPTGLSSQAGQNFANATGMDASILGGVMSNRTLQFMTQLRTGMNAYSLYHTQRGATAFTGTLAANLRMITGYGPDALSRMRRTNHRRYGQIMSPFWTNPQLAQTMFGMDPQQLDNLITSGSFAAKTQASAIIAQAREAGWHASGRSRQTVVGDLHLHGKALAHLQSLTGPAFWKEANKDLNKIVNRTNENKRNHFWIEFRGDAAKYFKLTTPENPSAKQQRVTEGTYDPARGGVGMANYVNNSGG